MDKIKKYFSDIAWTTGVISISIFLSIGLFIAFALNIPSAVPVGTESGGTYTSNFNKIFQDCGTGKGLRGYDSSKNKICDFLPIDGNCGSSRGSCNAGNLSWTNNTSSCGTTATWNCNGLYGGTTVNCSYFNGHCPINGSCGGSRGTCNSGSMTWTNNTSSCDTSATWSCSGQYGGTTANCSQFNGNCPINGSCGGSRGSCSSGSMSWINNTSSCGTSATWSCSGQYGGSSTSCSEYNGGCPVNGSCGSSGSCSSGYAVGDNGSTSCGTSRTWSCSGYNGGSTASCSQYNGSCCVSNYGQSCTHVGYHSWSFSCSWGCGSGQCIHPGGSIASCSSSVNPSCGSAMNLAISGQCRDESPGTINCSGTCVKN